MDSDSMAVQPNKLNYISPDMDMIMKVLSKVDFAQHKLSPVSYSGFAPHSFYSLD